MTTSAIVALLLVVLLWSLIAERLADSPITGPMVMVSAGLLTSSLFPLETGNTHAAAYFLAELTLIIVLFSDASRISLPALKQGNRQPLRMLLIGLPGCIAIGTLIGLSLFPTLGFWSVALLAAILAPTVAALGEAVVSSHSVPEPIRQTLSVESGLNDGLVVPVVLLLACGANITHNLGAATDWLLLAARQIGFGTLAGLAIGYAGALATRRALDAGTLGQGWQGVASLALAGLAWAIAELLHGNGFISAFIAGLVFGNSLQRPASFLFAFQETEGQLLVLATFALFGALMLPGVLTQIDGTVLLYAIASLSVVRMLPIVLSLLGTATRWRDRLFLAWFGPRGLASILFVLLVGESAGIPQYDRLTAVVFTTVALSVLLHGLTAGPLSRLYSPGTSLPDTRPAE